MSSICLVPAIGPPTLVSRQMTCSVCVKSPFCRLSLEQIREWYDGYVIGGEHIFNPYSVCRAVIRNECIGHWIGTSSNEEAARLIGMPFPGLQEDILNLAAGGRITFDSGSFQNDMDTQENKDQIFALLVCLGYLGCTCETASCHSACVPNREIRYALCSMVRRQPWFAGHQVTERSDRLFRAITSMDAATAGEILGSIHNSSYVSHLGYNSREALGFCKASGLLWTSEVIYDIRQELSSGRGWFDMVFLPRISTLPVMIFEFKRDSTATDALKKIRDQGYAERYSRGGVDESVLLIGLA